ncbi:uncharacterized protein LOC128782952 [Vidua chalybeata]|uniref:uncharacterized protein LOC128782952 n=1 Tax=Vidua chalybeata TaxID=81927 RepID=UPI0023A89F86|nr:uncharacterized protein LOC128782952 [Vidua chalybeata]
MAKTGIPPPKLHTSKKSSLVKAARTDRSGCLWPLESCLSTALKHWGLMLSFLWKRTVLLIYREVAESAVPPTKFPTSKGCFQTKATRTERSGWPRPLVAAFHLPLKHWSSVLSFLWNRNVLLLQVSMSEIGIPALKFPIAKGCSQPKSASTVKSDWPWPLVAAPATLGLGSFLPMEIPVTLWGPHGTKGIIVAPLEPMEPRGHGDTAGLHGPRDHSDFVGPDGTMETMWTLQALVSPRGHCDTSGPPGSKGPLGHCGAPWNRGNMEQVWLAWPPMGHLTGLADLGMPRAASHQLLQHWGSVFSLLWKRTVPLF